jgi:type I restriction-modification system DNA methylase subunit
MIPLSISNQHAKALKILLDTLGRSNLAKLRDHFFLLTLSHYICFFKRDLIGYDENAEYCICGYNRASLKALLHFQNYISQVENIGLLNDIRFLDLSNSISSLNESEIEHSLWLISNICHDFFYNLKAQSTQPEKFSYYYRNLKDWIIFFYEWFLLNGDRASSKSFVPNEISDLIHRILKRERNETIYDPRCGFGDLLYPSVDFKGDLDRGSYSYGNEGLARYAGLRSIFFFINGLEKSIFSIVNPLILSQPQGHPYPEKFDCIASFIPGGEGWKLLNEYPDKMELESIYKHFENHPFGPPNKSYPEYYYILHAINLLKGDTGRAVLILPNTSLQRIGQEEKIRRELLKRNLIHAVIKLPEGILFPHNQSYSILVLKMGRDKAEKIKFIDASTTSRQLANRRGLWLEDIVRIMNLMEKPSTKDLYVARAIEPKKILESSEVDLTVPQYISQPSESMDITQQDLLTQITSLEEIIIILNEKLNNLSDKL